MTKLCYGNGFAVRYEYNELDNITEIWYTVPVGNSNGTVTYQEIQAYGYTYTAYGQLYRFDNLRTGKSIIYKYDTAGKMTSFVEFDTEDMTNEFSSTMFYNEEGKLDSLFYTLDYSSPAGITDHDVFYFTSYEPDGSLSSYSVDTDVTRGDIDYAYDAFKRLESKTYDFHVVGNAASRFTNTTHYEYSHNGNSTSAQISEFSSAVGTNGTLTSTYTYDDYGNITKIHLSDGTEYRYVYDNLGQLIREDNTALNKTYVYTYDNAGNILCKETYALTAAGITPSGTHTTVNYDYNDPEWGDLLTSYNGQTITYDEIGNPLNLNGYTLTWEGRRLTGMTMNAGQFGSTYEYNDDGIRISKTVSGVRHDYYLDGAQIEAEAWGNNLCVYLYDAEGAPIGMQYRTASMSEGQFYTFWFEKNLQGDIVAVYTENGTKIGSYTYDAWGNCTYVYTAGATSAQKQIISTLNPFRYRGYYYDTETGLYYLQSRYYNPQWGRFLNADYAEVISDGSSLSDKNLFVYCDNNPVMRSDDNGEFWHIVAGAAIGAVVVGLSSIISQAVAGEDINWTAVAISAASGAISGAINAAVPCMGAIATGLVEGTLSAATYAATEKFAYGRDPSLSETLKTGLVSGITAGVGKEIAQSIGLCNCFIAGTLIAAETGYVTIENIKAAPSCGQLTPKREKPHSKKLFSCSATRRRSGSM